MKTLKLAALAVAVLGCWSSTALAEVTVKPAAKAAAQKPASKAVELPGIVLHGRRQHPAAVDVARIPISVTLSSLRQPFLDRIGKAIDKRPF